ncbi:MAG: glycosyltransferase [Candidatus Omnitrophota bacterium]
MEDGTGNYVWGIASYLKEKGFIVQIVWVKAEGWLIKRGFWLIPRRFARQVDLHIIGEVALGRLRVFPKIWWLPLKAKALNFIKIILKAIGVFRFMQALRGIKEEKNFSEIAKEIPWDSVPTKEEKLFFQKKFKHFNPDIILAIFYWMCPLWDGLEHKGALLRICLAQDIMHMRKDPLVTKSAAENLILTTKEQEKKCLSSADVIAVVSEDGREFFHSIFPEKEVILVSNGVEVFSQKSPPVAGRCLFVSGFQQYNVQGLRWFLSEIWPKIIQKQPEAELHVCGNVCKFFESENYPNVKFLGRLETLENEYKEAQVVVIPVLFGTGLSIRLTETFSFGKACVTTTVGIRGLKFACSAVICSDKPDEFAESVIRLLKDSNLRMAYEEKSKAFAREYLSKERCYQPLIDVINKHIRLSNCRGGATIKTV